MQKDQSSCTGKGYAPIVGKRLRAIREESGYAASDVAEHLNIPTALYSLYEEDIGSLEVLLNIDLTSWKNMAIPRIRPTL